MKPDKDALVRAIEHTQSLVYMIYQRGNKNKCLAAQALKVMKEALANHKPVETVTVGEDKFNRAWDRAYHSSRGANVFNDTPSFKHRLKEELEFLGLRIVKEKDE